MGFGLVTKGGLILSEGIWEMQVRQRVADALLGSEQLRATLCESIRSGGNPSAQHALLVLLPCCHISRALAETLSARGLSKVRHFTSPRMETRFPLQPVW